eukprot:g14905.t1
MGLPLELDGAPFSAEGLKSTKQTRTKQLRQDAEALETPPPEGYTNNSNKEALCLEYIGNFRAQFDKLYPGRRRLFLTAPNEYGVEKFVCTTLRPTLLPHREIYDLEKCAEFVSNFLHYEPLDRPTEPPSCLPSSGQVLEWTVGDCFDFAMVLCSLLLGAGYDAYVVYGTAPRWITVRDRARTLCPYIASTMPHKAGEEAHENGIGMPPQPAVGSKLDDKEGHSKSGSQRGGAGGGTSGSQRKSRQGGGPDPVDAGAGSPPEVNASGGDGSMEVLDARAKDAEGGGEKVAEDKRLEGGDSGGGGDDRDGVGGAEDGAERLEPHDKAEDKEDARPYSLRPRGAPTSMFLQEVARRAAEAKEAAKIDPWESDGDEEEEKEAAVAEEEDPLRGQRMHAWVLVRGGKRGVMGMSYVEPTTGAVYPTSAAPYLTVEALFNAKNYWVNMQQQQQQEQQPQQQRKEGDDDTVKGGGSGNGNGDGGNRRAGLLSFDLLDGSLWEYVFIDPMQEMLEAAEALDENDDLGLLAGAGGEEDDEEVKAGGEGGGPATAEAQKDSILDIPPSWVRQLNLSRDLMALRYPPRGQRTIMYRRAKAELFAENVHAEGTTLRLTLYKDRRCTIAKEIREVFVNRADRLYSRVRYPLEGKVSELFRPGRANALRNLITWSGRRRELYFFVEARLDGLVSRVEDIGQKVIQTMQGRGDRLTYRSVNVMSPEEAAAKNLPSVYILPGADGAGDLVVYKMAEKFERRHGQVAAERDVAKRSYYLAEGRIRTLYHYPERDITRASKMHFKDNRAISGGAYAYELSGGGGGAKKIGGGDASGGGRNLAGGGGASGGDGTATGGAGAEVEETLQDAILAEKDCFTEARHVHVEMAELIKFRQRQEEEVILERPVFETARERRAEQEKISEQMAHEEEDVDLHQVDYLTPFLQHVPDIRSVSAADAQRARDACLKALKDRLLERANIINSRLNEETSALAKKQAAFQRNQRDNDANAEEEFEIFCSEAMFRIQVLEQRLVQHEENALKKYADVDAKLASDPRLRALNP